MFAIKLDEIACLVSTNTKVRAEFKIFMCSFGLKTYKVWSRWVSKKNNDVKKKEEKDAPAETRKKDLSICNKN